MSFVARLIGLVSGTVGPSGPADDAPSDRMLAVAALLIHVARVDGRIELSERERIGALLRDRLGLSAGTVARLVARADALDRETDDVAELVAMMGHAVPLGERRELVAMAYAVALADGRLDEFEDDLIWRTGHLLGLDDREIAAAKGSERSGSASMPAAPETV